MRPRPAAPRAGAPALALVVACLAALAARPADAGNCSVVAYAGAFASVYADIAVSVAGVPLFRAYVNASADAQAAVSIVFDAGSAVGERRVAP
jgi:hypothetical protein